MLNFDCRFRYPEGFSLELAFTAGAGITALAGPSGSGKTTTIQLIAGLLTPIEGHISLGERVYFDSRQRINLAPEDRTIGYVFQDYQLFPHMTVRANLQFGMRRTRGNVSDFSHLVEILELAPLLERYPQTLSGGERQRTALGRAILRGPELLLLDEPLSALDQELKDDVTRYLRQVLNEYHIPTLLVTHDRANCQQLATNVIQIADKPAERT